MPVSQGNLSRSSPRIVPVSVSTACFALSSKSLHLQDGLDSPHKHQHRPAGILVRERQLGHLFSQLLWVALGVQHESPSSPPCGPLTICIRLVLDLFGSHSGTAGSLPRVVAVSSITRSGRKSPQRSFCSALDRHSTSRLKCWFEVRLVMNDQGVLTQKPGVQRAWPLNPTPYPLNNSRLPIMSTVPQITAGLDGVVAPLAGCPRAARAGC